MGASFSLERLYDTADRGYVVFLTAYRDLLRDLREREAQANG